MRSKTKVTPIRSIDIGVETKNETDELLHPIMVNGKKITRLGIYETEHIDTKAWVVNRTEQLKDKETLEQIQSIEGTKNSKENAMTDLLDEYFPKGTENRARAILMMARLFFIYREEG